MDISAKHLPNRFKRNIPMADKKEMIRMLELSAAFKNAVESKYANDIAVQKKVQATVTQAEIESAGEKMIALSMEAMGLTLGGEPSESFLKANMEMFEFGAEVLARAIPVAELAACMPEELKNDADVEALKELGAPTLAKIAAFKP
jgi:hypothetical protein